MGFTYLTAILALVCRFDVLRQIQKNFEDASRRLIRARYPLVVTLAASLAYQLILLQQRQPDVALVQRPLSTADLANAYATLSVFESALLLATFMAFRTSTSVFWDRVVVAAGFTSMSAICLHYANTTGDVIAYVGFAMRSHPYISEYIKFPGEYHIINKIWLYPMIPSAYGPLWITISHALVAPVAGLQKRIAVFQIIEAIALASLAMGILRKTKSIGLTALVALNPFLLQTYVAEGHNDLAAVALAFIACLVTSAPIAIMLVILAGCVKATFFGIGMAAFVRFRKPTRAVAVAATLVGATASIVWAGPHYIPAIRETTRLYAYPLPPGDVVLHGVIAIIATLLVVYGLIKGRIPRGGAWTMVAFGQYPLANYLAWGLPYACATDTVATFLVIMPYAGFEMTNIFVDTAISTWLRISTVAIMIALTYATIRKHTKKPIKPEAANVQT